MPKAGRIGYYVPGKAADAKRIAPAVASERAFFRADALRYTPKRKSNDRAGLRNCPVASPA